MTDVLYVVNYDCVEGYNCTVQPVQQSTAQKENPHQPLASSEVQALPDVDSVLHTCAMT